MEGRTFGGVEHKISLQFNLRWSISCGVQRDQTAIKLIAILAIRRSEARKSRKFQVGTSFGSIHFAWTLNKKKKKREDISSSANYNPGRG